MDNDFQHFPHCYHFRQIVSQQPKLLPLLLNRDSSTAVIDKFMAASLEWVLYMP